MNITELAMLKKMGGNTGGGGGSSISLDTTLTKAGYAADAKAVGDRLAFIGSGGGASGGLSIKRITFTDRPTLWEWLKNEDQKSRLGNVVKITAGVAGALYAFHNFSTGKVEGEFYSATLTSTTLVPYGQGNFVVSGKYADINPTHIDLAEVYASGDNEVQTIPDEYWSAVGLSITVYYIG